MSEHIPTTQVLLDTLWQINRRLEGIESALTAGTTLSYSMPGVCKALDKSEPVVRGWIEAGRLKGTRSGLDGKSGAWMFSPEAVIAARDWQPTAGVVVDAPAAAKEVR